MALIRTVRGFTPKIGKETFLADNATIVGDVEMVTVAASGSTQCCGEMSIPSESATASTYKTVPFCTRCMRNRPSKLATMYPSGTT